MKYLGPALCVVAAVTSLPKPASAQQLLSGDVRLACEAVLCLAAAQRPAECTQAIRRYFSISAKRIVDTIIERRNFLNLCPAASQTASMRSLIQAIANGAGRCDAASINSVNQIWSDSQRIQISDAMPDYCSAYSTEPYANVKSTMPIYVGTVDRGGYWVEQESYSEALRNYNARIQKEDLDRMSNEGGGGGG